MKICIAQTESLKGDIQLNLQNHYRFIERAMDLGSDFIAFPELSITSYEPGLEQIVEAYRYVESGQKTGSVLLKIV